MNSLQLNYTMTGIKRILAYKASLAHDAGGDEKTINRFVSLFCEYQLADNNYTSIDPIAAFGTGKEENIARLSMQQVLQYITYVIWTDRFMPGFLHSRIKDNTLYLLLNRAEQLVPGSILPTAIDK